MARYSLRLPEPADRIEKAVTAALAGGARTPDLGGAMSTSEMTDAANAAL